jgi:hypothetical protein
MGMRLLPLICFLFGLSAFASNPIPFDDLALKVIREPNPFSFVIFNPTLDLSEQDFQVNGKATDWIKDSLQWVRVSNGKDEAGILVPRARYRENGQEFEVALTGVENATSVRLKPRPELKTHYYFDSSCSPFGLHLKNEQIQHSWVMVTCHRINNSGSWGTKPVVLVSVLWEGEKTSSFQQINFDSEHSDHSFQNGQDSFDLHVSVAPVFHNLGVSFGVGPYSSNNSFGNQNVAFATLYASYYFNDALKMAAFGALPVRAKPELDFGTYLVLEQFRGVDERISLNLLLGAHVLSYVNPTDGQRVNAMSGPQGVELIFRDLFFRNANFVIGGFFYPELNQRSYMNTWVRYGFGPYFAELNFIEWKEPTPYFYSKSFGLSVGFPLFRIL